MMGNTVAVVTLPGSELRPPDTGPPSSRTSPQRVTSA
jgi:hypothetical protein